MTVVHGSRCCKFRHETFECASCKRRCCVCFGSSALLEEPAIVNDYCDACWRKSFGSRRPFCMVDELRRYGRGPSCFAAGSCHLTVHGGDLEALHALAADVGMRRSWFQAGRVPHYDLTALRRERALKLGAVFVPARQQVFLRRRQFLAERGIPT